jgi:hypothetical protein
VRRLERVYGAEAVRAEYDQLKPQSRANWWQIAAMSEETC